MTKISSEDVRKVASLARLELADDQIQTYTTQLEKILEYVAQLEKIDTEGVKPTTRAIEVTNFTREDEVVSSSIREQLLELAPKREGDFFKVPKILS